MYVEIFNELVEIMHKDYAGCLDKKGWDQPELYRGKIKELREDALLTRGKFTELVKDYLLDFKDPHMAFKELGKEPSEKSSVGFKVRRYGDKLYVTGLNGEERLTLGDAIISLDRIPVLSLVEKHTRELMEDIAEREDWTNIITQYSEAEVMDKSGSLRLVKILSYPAEAYLPTYSLEEIEDGTLLLTLTDFANPDEISGLIRSKEGELSEAVNLIIDVRVNYGGSDAAFFEILPYLFAEEPDVQAFLDHYAMEFNCTDRNAELTIKRMKEQLSATKDEQFRQMLQGLIAKWEENRGKGFLSFGEPRVMFPAGKINPQNIVVLTDVTCGSSGDIFAYVCKMSPKVRVIGRPTAGLNDYSNLTKMEWAEFEFWYPTSRLKQIDARDKDFTHGVKPHQYIPWTPEHIDRDLDMEAALRLLKENGL